MAGGLFQLIKDYSYLQDHRVEIEGKREGRGVRRSGGLEGIYRKTDQKIFTYYGRRHNSPQ